MNCPTEVTGFLAGAEGFVVIDLRQRALASIDRNLSKSRGERRRFGQRFTPERERDLLAWAATVPDDAILEWHQTGPAMLRWIRDHQPAEPTNTYTAPDLVNTSTVLAEVIKRTGWRIEVFWNGSAGWFTARLISPWNRDGNATYPGGFLAPFDNPIGASGASPQEALVNLREAVLEWA